LRLRACLAVVSRVALSPIYPNQMTVAVDFAKAAVACHERLDLTSERGDDRQWLGLETRRFPRCLLQPRHQPQKPG
jgi:hypothetical protein